MNKKEPNENIWGAIAIIAMGLCGLVISVIGLFSFDSDLYGNGKLLFISAIAIYGGFMYYYGKNKDRRFYKCTQCYKIIPKKDVEDTVCPSCSGRLEDLIGFFDRNPSSK